MRAVLHFDGGCRGLGQSGPAAFGAILKVEGDEREHVLGRRLPPGATNNFSEYSGLIAGLEHALQLGVTELLVHGDSRVVLQQAAGRWKVKSDNLKALHERACDLARRFEQIEFEWVPRERNADADELVNRVLDGEHFDRKADGPTIARR